MAWQTRSALKLYKRVGFKYVPVVDTPFLTADIKMEMLLATQVAMFPVGKMTVFTPFVTAAARS
jgi:hypothetical protein